MATCVPENDWNLRRNLYASEAVGLEQFNVMGDDYTCHAESYETGGAVQILARVGTGPKVVNRAEDVRTVQSALNRFSPSQGGPIEPLDVDGKCGPKTLAAIHRFQLARLGWSDDRVDPGGPTIGYLSQNPAGLPALAPAAFEKIARVTGILTATRAALLLARIEIDRVGSSGGLLKGGSSGVVKKLNRHFHLDKSRNPSDAIGFIDGIYLKMQTSIGYIPQGITLFADDPLGKPYFAYAASGGYEVEVRFKNMQGGVSAGTIFLCARLLTLDDEAIPYVMIHELAHYVGPKYDRPDAITDKFGYQHKPGYDRLTPDQSLKTADCYSQFAFEAINRPFNQNQHLRQ